MVVVSQKIKKENMNNNIDIKKLLAKTDAFIRTMYYIKDDFSLIPKKQHIGTSINYSDLLPMRDEFVEEMVASVIDYVYSTQKQKVIEKQFVKEGRNKAAASTKLLFKAKQKFRTTDIKGQFSELLLFNLLQYHFNAVPLVRKMPITTNPALERNGADAIHIGRQGENYIIYLGEAKTYDRQKYSFSSAVRASIKSIIEQYENHRSELNLYTFEDFVEPELENIAIRYLNGELNLEVHLVCMVSYDNKTQPVGANREELLNSIMETIKEEALRMLPKSFQEIPLALYPRFNYIIFSVNKLEDLLESFKKVLGVG